MVPMDLRGYSTFTSLICFVVGSRASPDCPAKCRRLEKGDAGSSPMQGVTKPAFADECVES